MSENVITVLVDDPDSWIMPYVEELIAKLKARDRTVRFVQHYSKIEPGDVAFFLSCQSIVPKQILSLNKHNLVVHESALPKGKGWSPLTWQILEGKNEIPITLFEADEKIDAGRIYYQEIMKFEGHELIDELHDLQGRKTIELCLKFIKNYPNVNGKAQKGDESFYPRRKVEDCQADVNKTIAELFNNFRVADNGRYPVFFEYQGYRYTLRIEKADKIARNTNRLEDNTITFGKGC